MTDESGDDAKILAVPVDKLCRLYQHAHDIDDMPANRVNQTAHFFEHYKDLDEGKWVCVEGWGSIEEAKSEIPESIEMFKNAQGKPHF